MQTRVAGLVYNIDCSERKYIIISHKEIWDQRYYYYEVKEASNHFGLGKWQKVESLQIFF